MFFGNCISATSAYQPVRCRVCKAYPIWKNLNAGEFVDFICEKCEKEEIVKEYLKLIKK